jgi:uncharacterized protein
MEIGFYLFLFVAGIIAGISSGLLGIGGALIIIPILRYVPGLLYLHTLPLHLITGITSMQTTFGTLAASYFHSKSGNINKSIVINVGMGVFVGSFSGAVLSKYLSDKVLLVVYASFLATAAVLLLLNRNKEVDGIKPENIKVPRYKTILFGLIIGLAAGSLGFGGNVVIIPMLNTLFDIPMKICISSGTFIALIASFMSFVGKFATGQVELLCGIIISVSATIGALIGTELHKKASPGLLKYTLLFLILITLVGVVKDIFS